MTEEIHINKDNVTAISEHKTEAVDSETVPTVAMTEVETEQLMDAVRKQVEYYFSKENLQSDAYLTSHMDANMTVAIATVMKFAKMKALTQDEALLRKALERSTINIVDDRIKPNIKAAGRSTIILREIPSDTAEAEVREIFNFEGCKQITSMRSDIGDTWFVVMDSEDDAKDTLLDLRLKKRLFRGQSVKGRLKSETVVRSFYPVQAAPSMPPAIYPGMQMQYAGGFVPGPMPIDMRYGGYSMGPLDGMMAMGRMMPPPVPMGEMLPHIPILASSSQDEQEIKSGSPSQSTKGERRSQYVPPGSGVQIPQGSGGSSSAAGSYKGAATSGTGTGSGSTGARESAPRERKNGSASSQTRQSSSTGKDSTKTGAKGPKSAASSTSTQRASIEINSANFPPLQNSHSSPDDGPVPTPGYQGPFLKYSFDDIINIVKDIKDPSLPASIKPTEHPFAMTATANLDLLKRQRTFSIDETREQLKQGRPVQREAVLAGGAGDYTSMMYGDKEAPQGSVSGPAATTEADAAPAAADSVEKDVVKKAEAVESTPASAPAVPAALSDPKKAPVTGSWAAMVAANASAANGQTIVTNTTGIARISRPVGSKDSAPPSPDRKISSRGPSNGTSTGKKISNGSTSGSVTGEKSAVGDKNRDRRRGAERKEGDRKDGDRPTRGPGGERERRDRGGRERDPANKGTRRSENGSSAVTEESSNVDTLEGDRSRDAEGSKENPSDSAHAPVLGWGSKPTFANILKQQQAAEANAATAGTVKKNEKQNMVPLSASTGASQEGSASYGEKEPRGDKEKDKGEKSNREKSAPQGQATGGAHVAANKKAGISAGVWAKETLPPLKSAPLQSDV